MTEAPQAPETPQFSLQDIENAVKVIDAACTRGAFRGEEMSGVGAVRDRLVQFLQLSTPQNQEETAPEEVAKPAAKKATAPKKPKA